MSDIKSKKYTSKKKPSNKKEQEDLFMDNSEQ